MTADRQIVQNADLAVHIAALPQNVLQPSVDGRSAVPCKAGILHVELDRIFPRISKGSFLKEASPDRILLPQLRDEGIHVFMHQHFRVVLRRQQVMLDDHCPQAAPRTNLRRNQLLHLPHKPDVDQMPGFEINPKLGMILVVGNSRNLCVLKQLPQLALGPKCGKCLRKRLCHICLVLILSTFSLPNDPARP